MKLTRQQRAWLQTADLDGRLDNEFPSGRRVSPRTLRRLEGAGLIKPRAYGAARWSQLTDAMLAPKHS